MINVILIGVSITLLYLIISLISFNPADPGWLQTTWDGSIHNVGGMLGAKISDFLFFIFGIPVYVIPLFLFFYLWKICVQGMRITVFIFIFKLIGILILLFACCGLAHITIDNFFYFSSGGIVGSISYDIISSYEKMTHHVSIILFFFIGIIDITVFFNKFFGMILKTIKNHLFNYLRYLSALFFCKKKYRYQFIHQKSCAKRLMYPLVFSTQDPNFLKNLKNDLLNIQIIPDVSKNISRSTKQFNPILKNNFFKMKCISAIKIFSQGYNYYQKKYVTNVVSKGKNCSVKNNKFDQTICSSNNNIHCVDKREQKHNVSLIQDLNVIRTDRNNIDQKIPMFVKKNIKQHVPLLKYKKVPTGHPIPCYNNRAATFPNIDLLTTSSSEKTTIDFLELKKISQFLESKLLEYHIVANVANIVPGPVITRFELNLSPGIKSSRISNLSRDLARVLYTNSVKVVDVIPGTPYVGLEIPNKQRRTVYLGDIIGSDQFRNINTPLALVLGKDISGQPLIIDLKSLPHLLVAGTTGSGKSVGINAMIISLLYKATPEEVRFIMIDPKILELSIYSGIPHLLKQIITNTQEVYEVLQWCVKEMERRYKLMAMLSVRNLENYNSYITQCYSKKYATNNIISKYVNNDTAFCSNTLDKLPYIVIIVDEFSDLMMTTTKKVEELVIRLTQKARAAGIHVILATQRPSVNVITGVIKANIPARIAFTVSSKIDSRTILDQSGAESLLGMGDMLYLGPHSSISTRVHGAFIEDREIRAVVNFWKNQTISS
ncbi:DNA translocase FtsK 4TM domain-containing protein [Candidatus Blochmanniella camponoti]|uniref:DNA translocase FtsK 4TM domain-containing protein n=1 Tax=Candidatus Blochmanniella camponoti TaxID=108080 RepID=A0AAE9IAY5_9ENTR|nr:DNA translocase FtsK [Candidatus Blochmannia herculeanus]URJ27591.1 DNA translocase FtsK 4TM domain-containing protein [Candidatus Blochmannia herculeanus]